MDVVGLELHTDLLPNLHHVLYAAAWDRRASGRRRAGVLPTPLTLHPDPAWDDAVAYYDAKVASQDLLFGADMKLIGMAIATGRLGDPIIGADLRGHLTAAMPVYQRLYWSAHDLANQRWIDQVRPLAERIGPRVIGRLERLMMADWPVRTRADVVWVGNWAGGYTSMSPAHITLSSTDRRSQGTAAVEIFFHEATHLMAEPLQRALAGDLWHAVQFYLVGRVVQEELNAVGIDYTPYLYATGLLDRAWSQHRGMLETHWCRYAAGLASFDETIARLT